MSDQGEQILSLSIEGYMNEFDWGGSWERIDEMMHECLDDYLQDPVEANRQLLLERMAQAQLGILEIDAMIASRQNRDRLNLIADIFGSKNSE